MSAITPAWVSIHDLMPHTLDRVGRILQLLEDHGCSRVDLLVVPGLNWRKAQFGRLHQWAQQGHRLVAHGWKHQAPHVRGLQHRLHAAVLSRDVAEHLSCTSSEELALMQASQAWFTQHDLPTPSHYVPPAWALGSVNHKTLSHTGFASIEVLQGCLLGPTMQLHRLPLVGFEADTRLRARALAPWNQAQETLAQISGRPLRIGLHPDDLELKLAPTIAPLLSRVQPIDPQVWLSQITATQPDSALSRLREDTQPHS